MKIAHVSDIHFYTKNFSAKHLLSKKLIGKINASTKRKDFFITNYLDQFLGSLIKENVDILLVTGDFTTTAEEEEFLLAKQFIEKVQGADIKVFALPGNHDAYTKRSYKKRLFYNCLDILPSFSNDSLHFEKLTPSWDLLLLDTTKINLPFVAQGNFEKEQEALVKETLKGSSKVIVGNHFPLQSSKKYHSLLGGDRLEKILLDHDDTVLYLHGHTHKTAYHKEGDNLHIFNSSEVTVKNKFTYHIIDLNEEGFTHKQVKYFD